MNIELYKLIITVLIAIGGWYVGHYFAWKRDQKKKKRDLRLEYLQATYENLNKVRSYSERLNIDDLADLLIGILSDIELFGTDEQIKYVRKMSEEVEKKKWKELHDTLENIIDNLRDDLRSELNLSQSKGNVTYFLYKQNE